ncbi:hypothetical protein, partial [Acinetobacter baumannii]
MNSFTHQIKDSRQQSEIQSFYEPALRVLGHLFEVKKQNLRNKGYDENNAAVTRDEFMQGLVNDHGVHGINLYHAG